MCRVTLNPLQKEISTEIPFYQMESIYRPMVDFPVSNEAAYFDPFLRPISTELPGIKTETQLAPYETSSYSDSSANKLAYEELLLKRRKQNEAAKKCRQKKQNQLKSSIEKVESLEKENFEMSVKLSIMEKEKEAWSVKERSYLDDINFLKQQLDQTNMLLMERIL